MGYNEPGLGADRLEMLINPFPPAASLGATLSRIFAWALLPLLICASSGCIRIYQPMSGLHRPVIVDTRAPNFQDTRLTLDCVPSDDFSREATSRLCDRVQALFENQGARVELLDNSGLPTDLDGDAPEPGAPPPTADLVLQLRSRQVHQSKHTLSWVLCVFSFTLYPGSTEASFAQDVSIRDGSGFLLVQDTLEGRLVERFGAGTWVGNKLFDLARQPEDRIAGDAAARDLSADLYRQLSQLLFNAKMQWQVLRASDPDPTSPPAEAG